MRWSRFHFFAMFVAIVLAVNQKSTSSPSTTRQLHVTASVKPEPVPSCNSTMVAITTTQPATATTNDAKKSAAVVFGTLYYDNQRTIRYKGEMLEVNQLPHGQGTEYTATSMSYTGGYAEGKRHGYGVYIYPNGDKYEGQWNRGLRHGVGCWEAYRTSSRCIWYRWENNEIVFPPLTDAVRDKLLNRNNYS